MEQISKLPVDFNTWQKLNYDESYYVPNNNPLDSVAQATIKFYKNRLNELDLTEENRDILRDSISRIKHLMNYKI